MNKKSYFVYFMTNKTNSVLYIGTTSNLLMRAYQHKNGLVKGFTKKYNCKKLTYYEEYTTPTESIKREKQLKRWSRKKKDVLVNKQNPSWLDLYLKLA